MSLKGRNRKPIKYNKMNNLITIAMNVLQGASLLIGAMGHQDLGIVLFLLATSGYWVALSFNKQ